LILLRKDAKKRAIRADCALHLAETEGAANQAFKRVPVGIPTNIPTFLPTKIVSVLHQLGPESRRPLPLQHLHLRPKLPRKHVVSTIFRNADSGLQLGNALLNCWAGLDGHLGHASLRVLMSLACRPAFCASSPPAAPIASSSPPRVAARLRQAAWVASASRIAAAVASCRLTSATVAPSALRRRSTERPAAWRCASMTLSALRMDTAAASRWSANVCCARAFSFAP